MTTWQAFFKAEQLRLQFHRPEERKIRPRVDPSSQPTAAPKRKLVVPQTGHKSPPGGGWRRTPSGWARGQGNDYEWQPLNWKDKGPKGGGKKQEPKLSAEDHKELRFWLLQGPMIADPAGDRNRKFVEDGYLEVSGPTKDPNEKRKYLQITAKGRDAIHRRRAELIEKLVREGKHRHADVAWARVAVTDAAGRHHGSKKEREAEMASAIEALYQAEKKHGARPTTARGVKEALGIPDSWRVPERGAKPAADVYTGDGDHLISLRWTGDGFRGQLYYRQYHGGGSWQPQGKAKPASEIVASQIERERKWKERVESSRKRRK